MLTFAYSKLGFFVEVRAKKGRGAYGETVRDYAFAQASIGLLCPHMQIEYVYSKSICNSTLFALSFLLRNFRSAFLKG